MAPTNRSSGRCRQAGTCRLAQTCVPGMARNFVGASPTARYSQSRRLGKRQGRRREAGSGGSRTQSCGAMNKNGSFENRVGAPCAVRGLTPPWRAALSPPLAPPQGGEVLAAGRARGQAQQGFACHEPSSVRVRSAASRVRYAGLRLPLTRPTPPTATPIPPTQNSKEAQKPDMRRDASGASGHVTAKPSICGWDAFCKSGARAATVTCLTPGGLSDASGTRVRVKLAEDRETGPDRRAGVSRRHRRSVAPDRRPEQ